MTKGIILTLEKDREIKAHAKLVAVEMWDDLYHSSPPRAIVVVSKYGKVIATVPEQKYIRLDHLINTGYANEA